MNSFELLSAEFPWLAPSIVFLFGLCAGSFLNVCIYRMPRGLSVVLPGSFCPVSGAPLRWWENIPVLSFLFLAGRGRVSHQPISWQYPIVELLTACIFFTLWNYFSAQPAVAIALMVMSAIFIAGSFIDWQFKIIPDLFTVGGTVVGLIACLWVPQLHGFTGNGLISSISSFGVGLMGVFIGSAVVLWMAIAGELIFRREAMGFGDVKLMGLIGAFLGWQGAVFSLFAGAFIGLIVVFVMLMAERISSKKSDKDKNRQIFGREIPFGPMLCTAAFIYIFIQPHVLSYWSLFLSRLNS